MQLVDIPVLWRTEESYLKRLLWPQIGSDADAELVGQRGLRLCMFVAAAWMIGGMFTPRPYLDALIGLMYLMAAMGVRQHSVPAAVLAFLCLLLDRVAALEAMLLNVPGGGNPRIGIVVTLLLLLNIRATVLAHRWRNASSKRSRSLPATSFWGRFANHWPPLVWPKVRYVFYVLACLFLLMSVGAMCSLPSMSRQLHLFANYSK